MKYNLFCQNYAAALNIEARKVMACEVTADEVATWPEVKTAYTLSINMMGIVK